MGRETRIQAWPKGKVPLDTIIALGMPINIYVFCAWIVKLLHVKTTYLVKELKHNVRINIGYLVL